MVKYIWMRKIAFSPQKIFPLLISTATCPFQLKSLKSFLQFPLMTMTMTMTAIYYLSDLSCTSNQPLLIDTRRPQQAAKRKFHKTSSSIDKGLSNKSAKKREFFSSLQGIPLSSSSFVCFVLGRCLNLNNLNPNLPSFLQKTCSTILTLNRAFSQFLRCFILYDKRL